MRRHGRPHHRRAHQPGQRAGVPRLRPDRRDAPDRRRGLRVPGPRRDGQPRSRRRRPAPRRHLHPREVEQHRRLRRQRRQEAEVRRGDPDPREHAGLERRGRRQRHRPRDHRRAGRQPGQQLRPGDVRRAAAAQRRDGRRHLPGARQARQGRLRRGHPAADGRGHRHPEVQRQRRPGAGRPDQVDGRPAGLRVPLRRQRHHPRRRAQRPLPARHVEPDHRQLRRGQRVRPRRRQDTQPALHDRRRAGQRHVRHHLGQVDVPLARAHPAQRHALADVLDPHAPELPVQLRRLDPRPVPRRGKQQHRHGGDRLGALRAERPRLHRRRRQDQPRRGRRRRGHRRLRLGQGRRRPGDPQAGRRPLPRLR